MSYPTLVVERVTRLHHPNPGLRQYRYRRIEFTCGIWIETLNSRPGHYINTPHWLLVAAKSAGKTLDLAVPGMEFEIIDGQLASVWEPDGYG